MKLQHFAIGARFEYEGKIFVKTGPLTATSDSGGQQLIPRYAILKPLDQKAPEQKTPDRGRLNRTAVLAAFDRFYRTCERLTNPDERTELEKARDEFICTLK